MSPNELRTKRDALEQLQTETRRLELMRDEVAARVATAKNDLQEAEASQRAADGTLSRLRNELAELDSSIDKAARQRGFRKRFSSFNEHLVRDPIWEELKQGLATMPPIPPSRWAACAAVTAAVGGLIAFFAERMLSLDRALPVFACAAISLIACADVLRKPGGGRRSATAIAIAMLANISTFAFFRLGAIALVLSFWSVFLLANPKKSTDQDSSE